MSENIPPSQNRSEKTVYLERQIKSARRERNIGIALVSVSLISLLGGLLVIELAPFVFLTLFPLFPLLLTWGLILTFDSEHGSKVKRLEEELKQLRETYSTYSF